MTALSDWLKEEYEVWWDNNHYSSFKTSLWAIRENCETYGGRVGLEMFDKLFGGFPWLGHIANLGRRGGDGMDIHCFCSLMNRITDIVRERDEKIESKELEIRRLKAAIQEVTK